MGIKTIYLRLFLLPSLVFNSLLPSSAQIEPNYDESKVPFYTLPDPLLLINGKTVKSEKVWIKKRRAEILGLFELEMYGKVPGKLNIDSYKIVEENKATLDGKATRKQVLLKFENNGQGLEALLLMYLPRNVDKAPLFVGYNFYGNHTISKDEHILLSDSWVRNNPDFGITDNRGTAESRGVRTNRWAIDKILEAGYGLATIYYGDIDPDKNDFTNGIHPLFYSPNQTNPKQDEWGSITAWAWGLTKAMDYFEADDDIDESRVIVMGHSRLGKTSLWAGALDERFAMVISNDSGCGGAALSRRRFGETVKVINTSFPHWFSGNFKKYNDKEDALPMDQHMLIALIAPRPVYIASAEEDRWADPRGEYLSGYYASPVYELFGRDGLSSMEMPRVNQPIHKTIGYHIRTGEHDVTDYDWQQFIRFANKHLD